MYSAVFIVSSAILGFLVWVTSKTFARLIRHFRYIRKFKALSQEPVNPIFGNLLEYPGPGEAGMAFQLERVKQHPRLDLVWLMQKPLINVNHPETLKVILKTTEPKAFRSYNLLTPWIGDGLLKSSGRKWARNRRLLTPAFHFEVLKNYMPLKNEAADLLVGKFSSAARNKTSLEVVTNVSQYTLDVILRSSMSYETNCQGLGQRHPYVLAINNITDMTRDRFFKPWFHIDWIYFLTPTGRQFLRHCKFVHDVADDIISKRMAKLESKEESAEEEAGNGEERKRHSDFLDILLTARDEDGKGLTHQEIRDEVDTFLFEGHDTTASAISWTLYSVASNPHVQEKIQQELDTHFADRNDDEIRWEDLSELPYLTMSIKESMRHHATVPFIQRELTKDLKIDDFVIPAGTSINIVIYNIHHNPVVWEDPLKFDPDRFLPENVEKRDPFAFVPFSAGPRNCIGQHFAMDEMKIALAKIFRRFSICLDPDHKVIESQSLVMKADNDIKLLVTERSPKSTTKGD